MKKTINIWTNGKWEKINNQMDFFVGRSGSGHTVFGENARLFKVNKNSLVFKTESGSLVKTERESLNTIGKARKEDYFVSMGKRNYEDKNIIRETVSYWNEKKVTFEYK